MNNLIQDQKLTSATTGSNTTTEYLSSLTGFVLLGGCLAMILTISTVHQILSSRYMAHHSLSEKPVLATSSDDIHEAVKKISLKHRYVSILRDTLPPGWEVGLTVSSGSEDALIYYVEYVFELVSTIISYPFIVTISAKHHGIILGWILNLLANCYILVIPSIPRKP
jgi:hypothetical protein